MLQNGDKNGKKMYNVCKLQKLPQTFNLMVTAEFLSALYLLQRYLDEAIVIPHNFQGTNFFQKMNFFPHILEAL